MAEPPLYSSQGSEYERHHILQDKENVESFPLIANNQKPRKPPTVTPKRFKKFFTPRASLSSRCTRQSKAGRQLRDITRNGANRRRNARPLQSPDWDLSENHELRLSKRRKQSIDNASSLPQSSPLKHVQIADQIDIFQDAPSSPVFSDEESLTDLLDDMRPFPQPLRLLRTSGCSRRILHRSFGGFDGTSSGRRGNDHCVDGRTETANFVSTPTDVHPFTGSALPFCTASCHTNSLIAIGEEEGGVRLIDTAPTTDFSTAHVAFRPHHNAIMDITFSSDDYMLATASGDQTGRIIDMHTQKTVCILSGHKSSVKQVRFQPNEDNVITTSSRDGSVLLWDMRCGAKGSVASLRTTFARNVDNGEEEPTVRYSKYSIDAGSAHRPKNGAIARTSSTDSSDPSGVSITSFEHLRNGREHLLLTTSEINSSIKVWDLRNVGRRTSSALISCTPVPSSHSKTRNYGINAMVLSGDSARVYTVCRDGIVYAYSTHHLTTGHAPDVITESSGKGWMTKTAKSGIGPLYGFKHPSLRIASFYVRASLRPARGENSEVLAIGSSENCAVLFPTDERDHPERERPSMDEDDEDATELPSLPMVKSKPNSSSGIPVHDQGTALVRGHNKEVTSLTWSHDGALVTIGDDFTARCWRENGEEARRLRSRGECGGQRWGCGWADVDAEWDEDDG